MSTRTRTTALPAAGPRPLARGLVAAGGAAVLALGLGACGGTAGDEDGASVEDVQEAEVDAQAGTDDEGAQYAYDGPYDAGFADQQDSLVGEQVTVSAAVETVLDDTSFTVAGDDSGVDPLLVVDAGSSAAVEPDAEVDVTGTVQLSFALAGVEEELGVDLEDELYAEWEGENYLVASAVDVGVEGG
ncbi:hypothetical protein [uncultured Pseudokineococcus sp.]|uniref:hypothetical protein n=1 Tax=uncultured Pseudokineococcus sp. TaxID=1642928 RepID=UPI00261A065D|nr:hypothetical protein [uncultured Pseudokineococcus sp.]